MPVRIFIAVVLGALVGLASTASAGIPLETAVGVGAFDTAAATALEFTRVQRAGATSALLNLTWKDVAPAERPADFNPEDHLDPAYNWEAFDAKLRQAAAARVTPIVVIFGAPTWALGDRSEGGTEGPGQYKPDPVEMGRFARAAAARYSGRAGFPRVRYWQVWNEPNISLFLSPQFVGTRPFSPGWYRTMVNEVADAVKEVDSTNLVIAGATAPFRDITPSVMRVNSRWGPLTFMRDVLCLSRTLRPTCRARIRFDIWAHHPYTSGGPTHHAVLPDDVSLADLPEMRRVLSKARAAGHIVTRGSVRFWVTEFSWDSNPPDPQGVPTKLLNRWVPEALYRMWQSGVSLVTWFTLRDEPLSQSFYQSGLYFRGSSFASDRPKPFLQGFRFPVVAFPAAGGRIVVWGRTPHGRRERIVIEQTFPGGWRRLGVLPTDRAGIFHRRFSAPAAGSVRATVVRTGERSLAFSLTPVPDRFFNPFGQTTLLEPRKKK